MPSKTREFILIVLLAVAVIGSTVAIVQKTGDYAFFDPLIDVKSMLDQHYVTELDGDALQQAAITGLIEALDDPFTVYVPPKQSDNFQKELSGEYVGIGAEVSVVDGWLTIVNPMEDSPALLAGIRADDRVTQIEGQSTKGKTIDESIGLIVGEPGTAVTLTVERANAVLEITIVRDHIKTREVKGFHRDPADPNQWEFLIDPERAIAYVRVAQFTGQCAEETRAALETAQAKAGRPLEGVVLDLRDNPGGILSEAIEMADLFLNQGVIVSTRGLHDPESVIYAESGESFEQMPLVVLLNGQSASASEVVAGALADNNRAIIVGERSFGKGSVQSVRPLPSQPGAVLKMTEQLYYLPSGRCLHRLPGEPVWGVDPSPGYFVPLDGDQYLAFLMARREQEILRPDAGSNAQDTDWTNPAWIVQTLADTQLGRGLSALQAYVDTGAWPVVDEDAPVADEAVYLELANLQQRLTRMMREVDRIQERMIALQSNVMPDPTPPVDLIPDSAVLTGGTISIFDAEGHEITKLRLTGEDLERWLMDADVAPIGSH